MKRLQRWMVVVTGALILTGIFHPVTHADETAGTQRSLSDLVPGKGFRLFEGDKGTVTFSLYTYLRYLNQRALNDSYESPQGVTIDLDHRDDLQWAKMNIYF